MKKPLFISILFCSLLLLSNVYEPTSKYSSLVVTSIVDGPNLPDNPFDYKVTIPEHILGDTLDPNGYNMGDIDTTILPLINNDIATLGRVLFYDKALSANEDISCGSCHLQSSSFADPKPLSKGVSTPTKRNSMQLNDLGWSNNASFFWDKKKEGMATAISLPLKDANEVGATLDDLLLKLSTSEFYPQLFSNAFGDDEITEVKILDAIAIFIASMNTFESRFDKVESGQLQFTNLEESGMEVFTNSCGFCHKQGNNNFFDFGIAGETDLFFESFITFNGYVGDGQDKGATQDRPDIEFPLFKMPTLRNVALTAPYMHDGAVPDLDSLINFYSHGIPDSFAYFIVPPGGFNFSEEEKVALKSFLLTLTDEAFIVNEKWSDPFENTSTGIKDDLGLVVKIMPNPFDQIATVNITGYNNLRKNVRLVNTKGQVVLTDYFNEDSYTIKRNRLTQGVYFMSIECQNKVGSYKVIVQ